MNSFGIDLLCIGVLLFLALSFYLVGRRTREEAGIKQGIEHIIPEVSP